MPAKVIKSVDDTPATVESFVNIAALAHIVLFVEVWTPTIERSTVVEERRNTVSRWTFEWTGHVNQVNALKIEYAA
ncbi:hypothetical protein COL940_005333 [Colletotrichum noveboracense]|nr:hypothetical protein COL940_005333 [Colletotrichum noveboracense]